MVTTEQVENARLVVRSRSRHGDDSLTLALNLSNKPFPLPAGARILEAEPAVVRRAVAPHGWAIVAG